MGQSRNENILENILGAENVLEDPQSRIETLLMEILEHGGTGGKGELYADNDGAGTIEIKIK